MKKLCVLGLGYIGLPTATMFAGRGFQVLGVDVDAHVLSVLKAGGVHIEKPGLTGMVQEAISSGRLEIESEPRPADVFIITVPTPITPEKGADLSFVRAAAGAIVPYLRSGNLVVLESTSPPGTTTGAVRSILEDSGLKAGSDFLLAYSPERVMPGRILAEMVNNPPGHRRNRCRLCPGGKGPVRCCCQRRYSANRLHQRRDGEANGEHL